MRLLTAILIGASLLASAQARQSWVARYQGPDRQWDGARAVAVDERGGVFVTGYSDSRTKSDFATIKYDAATGEELWVARYDGPTSGVDAGNAIAVDESGDVFVTGHSADADFTTIKYDGATGEELWVARYSSPVGRSGSPSAIAVDQQGDVFVTGHSYGTASRVDYTTVKYDGETGEELWVARYGGLREDDWNSANALVVDRDGNVAVTGQSGEDYGSDFATVKYDGETGAELWVARYDGQGGTDAEDFAKAIAVDLAGDFFVTGQVMIEEGETRYLTVKYDGATGVELWVARYEGDGVEEAEDVANAIAVDRHGDVFVTGESFGRVTDIDFVTIKYDGASGEQLWLARYNGPAGDYWDWAEAIALDPAGDVYVAGRTWALAGMDDFATVKYDGATGEQLWVETYAGPGGRWDWAHDIAVDSEGNAYVVGYSCGGRSFDFATVRYGQGASGVRAGDAAAGWPSVRLEPNPSVGGLVTLRYALPGPGPATVQVYDVTGRSVATILAPGRLAAGSRSLDLRGLSAGVYLVKVTAGGFSTTRQLVLQK